ncbi:D-inositol-3-phosphate glycosyltransferase [compost metagenome]
MPVVGGTAGGIPDAVRDGETGLLVNAEDPAAVAAAVRRILDDAPLHARLAEGGRAAVLSYYNWTRTTHDMRGIAAEFSR